MAASLSALLQPVSVAEFLSQYWRAEHLFADGSADRFTTLLSWTSLNRLLEHHWRETYRFRLARQGRDLDPTSYTDTDGTTPRIRATAVTDLLRRGATLSFYGVDELHEPVTRLAESFEDAFQAGTNVNIYAGWRGLHGLDLHRDDHEVFVLQIDGRKRWLLYGFDIDAVSTGDLNASSTPPAGATVDRILTPGSLLYVPRGCYHLAVPMDEPTLHLTVSVKAGSNRKARPAFSLPWSATPERLPPGRDFVVRLVAQDPVVVGGEGVSGSFELVCGSRTYRFPHSMRVVLDRLRGGPLPFDRLLEAVSHQLDEQAVRVLVALLIKEELVGIMPANGGYGDTRPA